MVTALLSLVSAGLRGGLAVDLVGVLEGAGHGPHVSLDGPRPALHVPNLLEAGVETVDQLEPGRGLLGEVCSV